MATAGFGSQKYDFQAHFVDEDYGKSLNGKIVRKSGAVPTIKAPTIPSGPQANPTKPLPLYSSPALDDHNYADFISNAVEPFGFDEGNSEGEEPHSQIGALYTIPVCSKIPENNTATESSTSETLATVASEIDSSEKSSSFHYFR